MGVIGAGPELESLGMAFLAGLGADEHGSGRAVDKIAAHEMLDDAGGLRGTRDTRPGSSASWVRRDHRKSCPRSRAESAVVPAPWDRTRRARRTCPSCRRRRAKVLPPFNRSGSRLERIGVLRGGHDDVEAGVRFGEPPGERGASLNHQHLIIAFRLELGQHARQDFIRALDRRQQRCPCRRRRASASTSGSITAVMPSLTGPAVAITLVRNNFS